MKPNKPKYEKIDNIVKCLYCNKEFTHVNNLYTHHKNKHRYVNIDIYIITKNKVKKYKCLSCGQKFKSVKLVEEHYRNMHINNGKKYVIIEGDKKKYKCIECNKIYSHLSTFYSHYKLHHNLHIIDNKNENKSDNTVNKRDFDDLKRKCDELEKLIKNNGQIINKTTNITNNTNSNNRTINNNTVNIQLVSYGNENLNDLPESYYIKSFRNGFVSVPCLLELIHFNNRFPQYKNIYIPNERKSKVKVYKDRCWQLQDKDSTIEDIYNEKSEVLEDKYNELQMKLDKRTKKMFERFLDKKDDDETIEYVQQYIRNLLYDKKNLVNIR